MQIAITAHYKLNDLQQLTVGVTEVAFPALSATAGFTGRPENIFVQSLSTNTQKIYIGKTGIGAGTTGGFELSPGSNMSLPMTKISEIYAIAGGAGQKLQICYSSGVS